jgi:hypothetical protein
MLERRRIIKPLLMIVRRNISARELAADRAGFAMGEIAWIPFAWDRSVLRPRRLLSHVRLLLNCATFFSIAVPRQGRRRQQF